MSWFSGSTKFVPQPEQKMLGLDNSRLSTNQQAIPVPLIYGGRPMGVKYITNAFNQRFDPVKKSAGKKDITVGFNYYCSFGALVGLGPADGLNAIYFDQEQVWPPAGQGGVTRGAEDSISLMIQGGSWTFYWGTETQPIDPTLVRLSANTTRNPNGLENPDNQYEEHPAYTGQCYFVVNNHFLGYNRTSIQNIEIAVNRTPQVSWIGANSVGGEANPVSCIVEAMTNQRYGLGLRDAAANDTLFDRTGLNAVASQLAWENFGISPLVTRQQPWHQVLVQLLEYFDGFYRINKSGLFTVGLVRKVQCGAAGIVAFDETDLTDVPELSESSWNSAPNDIRLTYTNAQNRWNDDAVQANSRANQEITGEPIPQTIDRPWITNPDLADRVARSAARALSVPKTTGTIKVRKSKLADLQVGDPFKLSYSHLNLCDMYCRCTGIVIEDPANPEVQVQFETEHGYLNGSTFTPPTYTAPAPITHTAQPIAHAVVVELPYLRAFPYAPVLAILAARPTSMTSAFIANLIVSGSTASSWTFNSFALHGTLDADYGATLTSAIQFTLDGADLSLDSIDPSSADEEEWLMLIGDEIFAIWNSDLPNSGLVSGSTFQVNAHRERRDTKRASHVAGDDVWIISKAQLDTLAFQTRNADDSGTIETFKLQSVVGQNPSDLGAASSLQVTFSDRSKRLWKPRDLAVNGSGSAPTWDGVSDVAVTWTTVNMWGNKDSDPFGPANSPAWMADIWYIEIRGTSDPSDYPDPNAPGDGRRWTYCANDNSATLPAANVAAALGGQVSFVLRIYARWTKESVDLPSRYYEELTVTKV